MNEFKPLPYAYDALEPFIDKETMMIHHNKHHKAYFDKFITAITGTPLEKRDVKDILTELKSVPEGILTPIVNNGGGYYHHTFFWDILKKDVIFEGEIAEAITKKWGSFDKFKEDFSKSALTLFGSGWGWLVLNENKELKLIQTSNQDCPLSIGKIPLLCIDVWEHAYYLKYQNKRPEYVENFFKVINWSTVNRHYLNAIN
ncbi:superoxide dismutase [Candidatus Woesearchaeota archaeon CG_4_10_14_0_2_um_filter_33_13]|nr:MAG: superoxide dismutase [Candidatus Woesearchaeota archaeon CG_4_10_14_0_2_um_filter_33_13]